MSKKSGISKSKFKDIMENHMHSQFDSLWIDLTKRSPYKLRLNGYKMIRQQDAKH